MPVWATILLPFIAFVYLAWLVANRISRAHARRRNLELFDWWMRQSRNPDDG